jgi:flagellar biosynthesis chaperone FliJ
MTPVQNDKRWNFNKQFNLSVLIELVFLAALIVGTWVNLQKQLSLLQHDITSLLDTQKQFQRQIEELTRTCITYNIACAQSKNLCRKRTLISFEL